VPGVSRVTPPISLLLSICAKREDWRRLRVFSTV